MKFENAVKLMETGEICRSLSTNRNYRIRDYGLQYEDVDNWSRSCMNLSDHIASEWELVEKDKAKLSDTEKLEKIKEILGE